MKDTLTEQYMKHHKKFMLSTMMGPNAMRVSEEIASYLEINETTRVLDLGCGMGLSSILLAEKFGATVFAADLWISPTCNDKRFKKAGLGEKIIPLFADATKGLPFAHDYFDVILCVDAYHYFGHTEEMLPSLLPYIKKGGHIAVGVPGLKKEFVHGIPEELKPYGLEEANFHTVGWWKGLWSKASDVRIVIAREMDCHEKAWSEWLMCSDNPYAVGDREMMNAEGNKYYNHVQLVAQRV